MGRGGTQDSTSSRGSWKFCVINSVIAQLVRSPENPRLLPIPVPGKGNGPLSGSPTSGGLGTLPWQLGTRRGCPQKNPGCQAAATPHPPPALLGFPVPGVATAHFLAQQTTAWGPGPALTHILLEVVGGEQRHLAGARARVAAVRLRLCSCSGLGYPRPRLPRRLGSSRVRHFRHHTCPTPA